MTEILETSPELQDDWALDSAIALGRDYLDATGQMPEKEHFIAFRYHGYFDYGTDHITSRLSWADFQAKVAEEYEAYLQNKEAEIQGNLQIIGLDVEFGAIDSRLFLKAEKVNGRFQFTDEEVSDEEKIRRFYTYKLVEALTASLDDPDKTSTSPLDPATRRLNIVLGFNIENGKKIGSTLAEISKSKPLSVPEVQERFEMLAHDRHWLDFVEPQLRSNHLEDVLKASIICEKLPLESDSKVYEVIDSEFYVDARSRVLVLGETALRSSLGVQPVSRKLRKLSELLLQEEMPFRFNNSEDKRKYKKMTREDYLNYGRWLLNILKPLNATLDVNILRNSHRLGIGPSVEIITHNNRFGSINNYFEEIGFTNRLSKGTFDHFQFKDYVEYVKSVAAENNGRVNIRILRSYYQNRKVKDVPTVWHIDTKAEGGITAVLEAAGYRVSNKKTTPEDILASGVLFAEKNGKEPSKRDIDEDPSLVSSRTVQKYFGSISQYKKRIREALEQRGVEPLAA